MSETSSETGTGRTPLGTDLILPVIGIALTSYYLIDTASLTWEARATGFIVGCVLLALCAVQIVRVLLAVMAGNASLGLGAFIADNQHNRARLVLLILLCLFIATIEIVGTTLGLFLLLFAGMWVLGVRNPTQLVSISAGTSATVYVLLIYLLGSRLPQGPLEKGLAYLGIGAG